MPRPIIYASSVTAEVITQLICSIIEQLSWRRYTNFSNIYTEYWGESSRNWTEKFIDDDSQTNLEVVSDRQIVTISFVVPQQRCLIFFRQTLLNYLIQNKRVFIFLTLYLLFSLICLLRCVSVINNQKQFTCTQTYFLLGFRSYCVYYIMCRGLRCARGFVCV